MLLLSRIFSALIIVLKFILPVFNTEKYQKVGTALTISLGILYGANAFVENYVVPVHPAPVVYTEQNYEVLEDVSNTEDTILNELSIEELLNTPVH